MSQAQQYYLETLLISPALICNRSGLVSQVPLPGLRLLGCLGFSFVLYFSFLVRLPLGVHSCVVYRSEDIFSCHCLAVDLKVIVSSTLYKYL